MLPKWRLARVLLLLFIPDTLSVFTNDLVLELDHDDAQLALELGEKHGLRFKEKLFICCQKQGSIIDPHCL